MQMLFVLAPSVNVVSLTFHMSGWKRARVFHIPYVRLEESQGIPHNNILTWVLYLAEGSRDIRLVKVLHQRIKPIWCIGFQVLHSSTDQVNWEESKPIKHSTNPSNIPQNNFTSSLSIYCCDILFYFIYLGHI